MSVNKYQPHVLVLPEDDANRQLANGFHLEVPWIGSGRCRCFRWRVVGLRSWTSFKSDHVDEMERYPNRFMVLLIDFDGSEERLTEAKAKIPADLTDRVFILGALTTPEALKQANLGSYEEIGSAMAKDCREETDTIWGHELLQHNASELDRLREHVRPILFP